MNDMNAHFAKKWGSQSHTKLIEIKNSICNIENINQSPNNTLAEAE